MDSLKHKVICKLCHRLEMQLDDSEILRRTPIEYGMVVNENHLNYLFDRTYDRYMELPFRALVCLYLSGTT
jgi:hypothetical protein